MLKCWATSELWFNSCHEKESFLFCKAPRPTLNSIGTLLCWAKLPLVLIPYCKHNCMSKKYHRPFPRVKWVGHRAAHLPLSSVKVTNTWRYIPTSLCRNGMQKENLTSNCGSERNGTGEDEQHNRRLNRNAMAVSLMTDPATQIRLWKCTVSPTGHRSAHSGDYVHGLRITWYFLVCGAHRDKRVGRGGNLVALSDILWRVVVSIRVSEVTITLWTRGLSPIWSVAETEWWNTDWYFVRDWRERELKSRTKVMHLNVSRIMTFYVRNQCSTLK
jgi:hypothetical protein